MAEYDIAPPLPKDFKEAGPPPPLPKGFKESQTGSTNPAKESVIRAETTEEKHNRWRNKAADILQPWLDAALTGGAGVAATVLTPEAAPITVPAATGWGHLAAQDLTNRIKGTQNVEADRIMKGLPRKASTSEELKKAGMTYGEGVLMGAVPEGLAYGGKRLLAGSKAMFPEFFTPKPIPEQMAGNALNLAGYNNPQYAAEQARTDALRYEVPGTYFTPGEATNNPEMLRLQQAARLKAGPTREIESVTGNKEASRNYLNQAIPDIADASTAQEAISKKGVGLQSNIQKAAENRAEQAGQFNPAERGDTGKALEGLLSPANEASRQGIKNAYAALGNEQTKVPGLSKQLETLKGSITPAEEDIFPKSEVARIQEMLPKPENAKPIAKDGLTVLSTSPDAMPFQDLVDVDQMLTRAKGRASSGSPLERNLNIVQKTVREGMLDQANSQGNGPLYRQALNTATKHFETYGAGTVEEALRPGNILRDASGKRMNVGYEDLGKKFWGERQSKELIRAVGKENAAPIMENHAVNELVEKGVINPDTGEVNAVKLASWIGKNKVTLNNYGLWGKFNGVQKAGSAFDVAQKTYDQFSLSAAGKFLGSEPRQALSAAFASNPTNPGQVMKELLTGIGDNKVARHGLKVAFKDLMVKEIEDAHGEAIKSISSGIDAPRTLAQRLDKYGLAAEELFADDPNQLRAMHKVREVMETTLRSQRNLGVGSNTADKFMAVEGAIQSTNQRVAQTVLTKGILRKIPGVNWYLDSLRATAKEGSAEKMQQAFKVISQALYDPPLSELITKNATTPTAQNAVARQIKLRISPAVSGYEAMGLDYGKQLLFGKPSDKERQDTIRKMEQEDQKKEQGVKPEPVKLEEPPKKKSKWGKPEPDEDDNRG